MRPDSLRVRCTYLSVSHILIELNYLQTSLICTKLLLQVVSALHGVEPCFSLTSRTGFIPVSEWHVQINKSDRCQTSLNISSSFPRPS